MRDRGAFLFLGFSIVLFFIVIFVVMEVDIDKIDFFEKFKKVEKKEVIQDDEEKLFNNIKIALDLKNKEKARNLIYDYFINYPSGKYLSEVAFLAAELYYDEKDYEKAIDFLVKARKYNVQNQKALFLMSKIAVEIDRFNPVLYSELTIAEKEVKADYIYIGLGYQNIYSKLYDEAIRCFSRVNDEEGFKGLARAYIEKGDYEKAIESYLKFFSIVDKNNKQYESVKIAFLKQTLYYANKLFDAKKENCTNYYNILAENFYDEVEGEVSLIKLANFYINKKDYINSIKYLQKALNNKITEQDEDATFLLGQTYYLNGNKRESFQIFNTFSQKYPSSQKIPEVKEWISLLKKEIY